MGKPLFPRYCSGPSHCIWCLRSAAWSHESIQFKSSGINQSHPKAKTDATMTLLYNLPSQKFNGKVNHVPPTSAIFQLVLLNISWLGKRNIRSSISISRSRTLISAMLLNMYPLASLILNRKHYSFVSTVSLVDSARASGYIVRSFALSHMLNHVAMLFRSSYIVRSFVVHTC